MTVYKKKVSTSDPRFQDRATIISGMTEDFRLDRSQKVSIIPVPNSVVLCNSCNDNIYSEECKFQYDSDNQVCGLPSNPLPCRPSTCANYKPKETFGFLIFFDKRDVKADRPYDFYCNQCVERHFPEAIEV